MRRKNKKTVVRFLNNRLIYFLQILTDYPAPTVLIFRLSVLNARNRIVQPLRDFIHLAVVEFVSLALVLNEPDGEDDRRRLFLIVEREGIVVAVLFLYFHPAVEIVYDFTAERRHFRFLDGEQVFRLFTVFLRKRLNAFVR